MNSYSTTCSYLWIPKPQHEQLRTALSWILLVLSLAIASFWIMWDARCLGPCGQVLALFCTWRFWELASYSSVSLPLRASRSPPSTR